MILIRANHVLSGLIDDRRGFQQICPVDTAHHNLHRVCVVGRRRRSRNLDPVIHDRFGRATPVKGQNARNDQNHSR